MKKLLIFLFYFIAFCAVSYFLRYYLNAPKYFIISLIISLAIILLLVYNRSKYTKSIGATLIIFHAVWLIGIFIPVYKQQPDIRQWYRRATSSLMNAQGEAMIVSLTSNGQTTRLSNSALNTARPLYQGDSISVLGGNLLSGDRVMAGLWDGSDVQIFSQSSITFTSLSSDFVMLTGSRTAITLSGGMISMHTRRTSVTPPDWSVRAGGVSFSCSNACLITLSGDRGNIVATDDFTWRTDTGTYISLSGGTYAFTANAVTKQDTNLLLTALIDSTHSTTSNRIRSYNASRQEYISSQRGWSMDTSSLLATVSKVKMALVGIIDRTYRDKYNNLALYEYLRGNTTVFPAAFDTQKNIYTFIE